MLLGDLKLKIERVEANEAAQVIDFIMAIRGEIFPMLAKDQLPLDLKQFSEFYLDNDHAGMFAAYSHTGEVVGTIGILPYDQRFPQLTHLYQNLRAAEVVKCYVDPSWRRSGIGTRIFQHAWQFSNQANYQRLYLHTHPFLPGAVLFWESQGFQERWREKDPVWQTVHMDLKM